MRRADDWWRIAAEARLRQKDPQRYPSNFFAPQLWWHERIAFGLAELLSDIYVVFLRPSYMMFVYPHLRSRYNRIHQYIQPIIRDSLYPRFLSFQYLSTGAVPEPYSLLYGIRHGPYNKKMDLPQWPEDQAVRLAQLTAIDEYCRTAMHYAVIDGKDSLILAVAQAGADLYACDFEENSPVTLLLKDRHALLLTILDNSKQDRTLFSLTVTDFFTLFNRLLTPNTPLPTLDESLPANTRIEHLPNDMFDVFTNTLSDFMTTVSRYPGADLAVKERLRETWISCLQVSKRPLTKSIFLQCVKFYKQNAVFFEQLYSVFVKPDFLAMIFKYVASMPDDGRLSLQEHAAFYAAIQKYSTDIQTKTKNIVSDPEKVTHRILLGIIPFYKRIGYDTDKLLPNDFMNEIGPLYKGIEEIPANRLHFLYAGEGSSSSRKPFDLDDILSQLKKSLTFQNPTTLTPLADDQIQEILKHPRAQDFLRNLNKQYRKEHQEFISRALLDLIRQLGVTLQANGGELFDEDKATQDLNNYLIKAKDFEHDIAALNKIRVYVHIRHEQTNYADLFDRRQHEGCTQYLGPSIEQYVAGIEAMSNLKLGESPLTKYLLLLPSHVSPHLTAIPPDEDLDGTSMSRNARKMAHS